MAAEITYRLKIPPIRRERFQEIAWLGKPSFWKEKWVWGAKARDTNYPKHIWGRDSLMLKTSEPESKMSDCGIGVSARSDYFAPLALRKFVLDLVTQAFGLGYCIARRWRF